MNQTPGNEHYLILKESILQRKSSSQWARNHSYITKFEIENCNPLWRFWKEFRGQISHVCVLLMPQIMVIQKSLTRNSPQGRALPGKFPSENTSRINPQSAFLVYLDVHWPFYFSLSAWKTLAFIAGHPFEVQTPPTPTCPPRSVLFFPSTHCQELSEWERKAHSTDLIMWECPCWALRRSQPQPLVSQWEGWTAPACLLPSGTFHCTSVLSQIPKCLLCTDLSLLAPICSGCLTGELLGYLKKPTHIYHCQSRILQVHEPHDTNLSVCGIWLLFAFLFFDRMCWDFAVSQSILPSQIAIVSYSHIPHPIFHWLNSQLQRF